MENPAAKMDWCVISFNVPKPNGKRALTANNIVYANAIILALILLQEEWFIYIRSKTCEHIPVHYTALVIWKTPTKSGQP